MIPSVEIDPRDIAALKSITAQMIREMPKSTAEIVTEVGKTTVGKAYAATPAARKKTRKIWDDKDALTVITLPPSKERSTPGRYYAKACWIKALKKLGGKTTVKPADDGSYIDRRRGLTPSFEASNDCPYIEALETGGLLDPIPTKPKPHSLKPKNIMGKAILRGSIAMVKKMDKFADKQSKTWAR